MAYSGAVLLAPIVSTPFVSETAAKQQSLLSCNTTTTNTTPAIVVLADDVDLRIPYWTSLAPCSVAVCLLVISAVWTKVARFKTPELLDRGT